MDERGTKKKMLLELSKRSISYHRVFSDVCGSVTAGLMLSQAFYWYDKTQVDGWFWKTQDQWTEETGMSRTEQENARKTLKRLGFFEEKRQGLPAKMFYRLDLDKVIEAIEALGDSCNQDCGKPAIKSAGNPQTGMQETRNLYKEQESTSESTPETTNLLSETSSDVSMKEKANKAVNILFAYYLEKLGRDPKKYTLTDKRKQQGLSRLRECFKKTGDLDGAILMMKDAIRKLAASDFHRQGKYVEWGDNLFKSAEKLEYWLNRDAVAPSAPPQGRDDMAEVIRQRGGPDALKRRHAERTGG